MSRKYFSFVLSVVTVVVIGFAATAQAGFIYTFDGLTAGIKLVPQDSWAESSTSGRNHWGVATGDASWAGNYAEQTSTGVAVAVHACSLGLLDNVSFDVSCEVRAQGTTYEGYLQFFYNSGTGDNFLTLGVDNGSGLYWKWNSNAATYIAASYVTAPTADSRVRVGYAFTALGGNSWSVQPYYQNITASGLLTNAGLPVTVNNFQPSTGTLPEGTMPWTAYQIVAYSNTGNRLDNINVTQVPEPSTLALLTAGLVGLLAYAWRKRK